MAFDLNTPIEIKNINDYVGSNPVDFYKKDYDHRFVTLIGNQPFFIEIWIYNELSKFKPFGIPMFFIEALAIEETLDDWNTKGWFVLSNDFEILERGALPTKEGGEIEAPYLFRNDGRNKLSIKIFPIPTKEQENFPQEKWEMAYDCVIYDVEDLKTNSSGKKSRKFYFWDERFQNLLERNLEWSTATHGPNKGNPFGKDIDRAMKRSDAIKSIIQTASNPNLINSGQESSPLNVGFDKPNSDSNNLASMDLFNNEEWDAGCSGEEALTLYTSPADACALDDINYVYSYFKSQDGSPAFLTLDRYDRLGGKRFSLKSLKKYIDDAENSQVEHIIIQDNQDPSEMSPYMPRAPFDESSIIKNFESGIASKIMNYKFSPMVSVDDMNISNKPINNYDFANGQFNILFSGNTINDVFDNMKKIAQKGLYSFSKGGQLLFNINKVKKTGIMTKNSFVPQTFYPRDLSYISMSKDFVFLNQALYFSSPGLTIRTPGNFIFVDRSTSTDYKNPFDDRFLGQWLINKVVHFFTKDKYTTDVICTKIDLFTKWFEESDNN